LSPTSLDLVWRMALTGFGFGLFQTPNNRTMIAAAPAVPAACWAPRICSARPRELR